MALNMGNANQLILTPITAPTGWDFLIHIWQLFTPTTGSTHLVNISANGSAGDDVEDSTKLLRVETGTDTIRATVRTQDPDVSGSGAEPNQYNALWGASSPPTGTWRSIAGSYQTALRETFLDTVLGATSSTQNVAGLLDPANTILLGTDMNGVSSGNTVTMFAELSIWDVTGFTAPQRLALVDRLGSLTANGSIVSALNVDIDGGQPWEGKGLVYVTLRDRTALSRTNLFNPTEVFAEQDSGWTDLLVYTHPSVEELADPPTITITNSPWEATTTVELTGTNFSPIGTAPTVTVNGVTQTVTDFSDTTVEITATIGTLLYGIPYSIVLVNALGQTTDGSALAEFVPVLYNQANLTLASRYYNITETPPVDNDPKIRLSGTPDVAIGTQVVIKTLTEDTDATPTVMNIELLDIRANAAVSFESTVALTATVLAQYNKNDGNGWSAFALQTFTPIADEPVLIGSSSLNYVLPVGASGTLTINTQVSTPVTTWTWSSVGTALPAWASLNTSTGVITYTNALNGVTSGIIIRATGTLQHVDITVSLDVRPVTNITALNWMQAIVYGTNTGGANQGWLDYWASIGFNVGAFNDKQVLWLKSLGYTGSLADMWTAWKEDNGIIG